MKTIGVLGGVGPQATMDFEVRVHRAAQRLLPPMANTGYPPMVVHYLRRIPFLLDEAGAVRKPLEPDPELFAAAERLGAMADFLVIPSNAPHLFRAEIERASGREVLSLIEVALAEVRRRGWKRIGVAGMGEPVVYLRPLEAMGASCEILAPEARQRLDAAILKLMEGREDDAARAQAREAVASLRARQVDGVLLGCTEIPLLLGADAEAADLLNPLEHLAEAAVRRAIA